MTLSPDLGYLPEQPPRLERHPTAKQRPPQLSGSADVAIIYGDVQHPWGPRALPLAAAGPLSPCTPDGAICRAPTVSYMGLTPLGTKPLVTVMRTDSQAHVASVNPQKSVVCSPTTIRIVQTLAHSTRLCACTAQTPGPRLPPTLPKFPRRDTPPTAPANPSMTARTIQHLILLAAITGNLGP
ncbi:hypothetical protein K458DRAFT_394029 [Lentithecium fluviatile CBS 122367]|uniref:Uncharacterized protein n=1 Tax=Lentithecium fluviatile CBS 122367 TaxID=1168545 RepID=A0A6G1IMW3_9PLEO|nr:hypothetical protein K458DRAFT_394029 [Lentithecium fluviatile CBS 122367]